MKNDQTGFYQHKVGYVHYHGTIQADALKYGNSGHTVAMYEKTYQDGDTGYTVVEWDKDGEYEISVDKYTSREDAVISYLNLAFGVSM